MRVLIDGDKRCRKCGVVKPLSDFHPHKGCKDGVRGTCRTCTRERVSKWFEDNRPRRQKVATDAHREKKLRAIEYLGGACKHCGGVFHPCAMQFHHLDPTEKEGNPSQLLGRKWERIVLELDKCILLCANCHMIEHHGGC